MNTKTRHNINLKYYIDSQKIIKSHGFGYFAFRNENHLKLKFDCNFFQKNQLRRQRKRERKIESLKEKRQKTKDVKKLRSIIKKVNTILIHKSQLNFSLKKLKTLLDL